MNIITVRLHDIKGRKVVIELQKNTPHLRRLVYFIGILTVCSVSIFLLIDFLGLKIFYGVIFEIFLLVVSFVGIFYGSYGLVNTLYEQPIMILTLNHIYLGDKLLFRSPFIQTSGINPKEDLKLIIVKDSRLNLFKVYLEGRKLLQLGSYKTINEAKNQRICLRNSLADFYQHIYVSTPKYHEV